MIRSALLRTSHCSFLSIVAAVVATTAAQPGSKETDTSLPIKVVNPLRSRQPTFLPCARRWGFRTTISHGL